MPTTYGITAQWKGPTCGPRHMAKRLLWRAPKFHELPRIWQFPKSNWKGISSCQAQRARSEVNFVK
jgi:hypothetical protein